MNELKSYTEYAVSTPTADFVIGFDFNYGEDAVNVTVDDVPATTAGYTVVYLNETTIRLSPSVPSGVVRLQRETDIDQTDHAYRAGAKFIAQTMDENFEQLRHSQQEVRDGFNKLSTDTHEIIEGLDAALELAQDAAQNAQDAAVIAQGAADTVNTIIVGGKVAASNVLDASTDTQQQVNYSGGSKWHSRVGGYKLNERVILTNGDIVKSTIDGNTNDPNVDMTGWVKTNSASQIFDESGLSQQSLNNGVNTIADMLAIQTPQNGSRVYVRGFRTPTNFALKTPYKGGGDFIYISSKAAENDGFVVYNGWVRQGVTTIKPEYNGAYGDGVTDDWEHLQKSSIYSILNKRELELDATTYLVSKPWYINAIDFARCQATATGKNVLAAHQVQYLKIRGQGFRNTIIRGTGKQVIQIGTFTDDDYGQTATASWYGELSDFKVEGDGVNTQNTIVGSFLNHFHFDNIDATGGVDKQWYIRSATWTPSLWCTFSNCRGTGGEITAKFECNSFTFDKRCFFGYGTQLCFEIIGSRNLVIGLSSEITAKSPLTPSFARVEGSCEFFSPDFECGANTNGLHAFIVAENSNLAVTMPTLIGIKGVLFKAENDNTTARWLVTPLLTQGRADNDDLNNWQIHSNKPISVQALPKWKYKRHEVKTIALTNTATAWSVNTPIMNAATTLSSVYLNALLPYAIKVQNTGATSVEVRIGLVDDGGTVTQVGSKTIPASSTVTLDDRELGYGISMYTGSHIRSVYISYRYTGTDGNIVVTPVSLEAQDTI